MRYVVVVSLSNRSCNHGISWLLISFQVRIKFYPCIISLHILLFVLFLAKMDAESPANVVFLNVAETYTVTSHEGITCYFKVDPSILPGVRHIVGIFPINWKSTKECIVCDWSPMPKDYQPDQPLDNCIQFSGEYCTV